MKRVVIVVVLLCMLCACGYVETQGQLVYVVDTVGYEWCYEVEGDVPAVGTVVDVRMYNNHTDTYIYDEEIVSVVVH